MNHRRLDIARIRNLGPKSTGRLESIGIHTVEDLERIGSVMAFETAEQHGSGPRLNLLYGMEAACGEEWREPPPRVVDEVKKALLDRARSRTTWIRVSALAAAEWCGSSRFPDQEAAIVVFLNRYRESSNRVKVAVPRTFMPSLGPSRNDTGWGLDLRTGQSRRMAE